MKEEKRSEVIHDALEFLDDDMIAEVGRLRGGVLHTKELWAEEIVRENKEKTARRNTLWYKWTALAAGIGLFLLIGSMWHGVNSEFDDMNARPENEEEIQENANLENKETCEDVKDLLDSNESVQEESEDSDTSTEGEIEEPTEIEE